MYAIFGSLSWRFTPEITPTVVPLGMGCRSVPATQQPLPTLGSVLTLVQNNVLDGIEPSRRKMIRDEFKQRTMDWMFGQAASS